ncbi:hypothetical protein F5X99DRAFT_396850 [Biscogniauxia marginata]|nr:hypothetical protein F5X99DRAFT_396850 [Biscogniauxia marginata]
MDIFSTTVAAGTLVIKFLAACSEFSSDAKSLKARFEWDLQALKEAQERFAEGWVCENDQDLAPEDEDLLGRTSEYLNRLVTKVHKNLRKIEHRGWLQHTVNMATWIARRSQIQEMEREIHEWTERLHLRVLSLPRDVRVSISAAYSKSNHTHQSTVLRSGCRLQEFLTLSLAAKLLRAREMMLRTPEELISKIREMGDISSLPFHDDDKQIIFSSREVSPKISPGTPGFETLVSDMGKLAAALNCLDPSTDVRILKVNYYFYHPDARQFFFAQVPPHHVDSMMTLQEFIKYDSFPGIETALNERIKVAYKLAEAVFFLHTAGFCHKNITSRSIVILRKYNTQCGATVPPSTTDEAYLMGFDLIRGADAVTYKENALSRGKSQLPTDIWDFDIFQHPARLQADNITRYNKAHDVYSLGVVLLELGFWQPLSEVAGRIDRGNPTSWAQELFWIAPNIRQRVGERYQRVVQWCLSLPGDRNIKHVEFMQKILDPLEEIMSALA